ncbi:sulfite exporter TauE/SafE family protein [uncultured Shewanella sp.]|uniref:sulfite exporter TauE/SafE family protein n=1 Tax=uncultured Shewanella sp. TaxID=173975 RepID=UPI0026024D07|nr:sulfite exporter TauE/SafE family protein [uncultured Shewanella sp.]
MEIIILVIAGFSGGILASLFGLGGGLVIVPALVICLPFYHVDPSVVMHLSVGTSLLIMLLNSLAAILSHHQANNINWLLFWQILPFALVGTTVGCIISIQLPTQILILLFLTFLFVILLRFVVHLIYRKQYKVLADSRPPMLNKALSGLLSGFIGAGMGVGSSLVMVPFLKRYGFYIRHCAGLSCCFNVLIALVAVFIYGLFQAKGEILSDDTTGFVFWPVMIWLVLGSIVGVPFGTWLGRQLSEKMTTVIYFCLLIIIFLVMLYKLLEFYYL